MKKLWFIGLLFYCVEFAYAQPKPQSSSEIYRNIQKLNTVGNAMYVAAHPDDENTLLIAWLSKEKKVSPVSFLTLLELYIFSAVISDDLV